MVSPRSPDILLGVGVDIWSTVTKGKKGDGVLSTKSVSRACPCCLVESVGCVCGVGCVCAFLGYFSVHLPSSKSCLSPLGLSHSRTETLSGCLSRHLALQGAGMIHRGMKPSEITAWSPRPLAASILVLVVIEEGRRHSACLCQASATARPSPAPKPGRNIHQLLLANSVDTCPPSLPPWYNVRNSLRGRIQK